MNTRTSNASNARDLLTTPASDRERGPTLLTERELKMVAAAGGGAGVNPSRHIVIPN
jgi:hypothetical protein